MMTTESMKDSKLLMRELSKPFHPSAIEWRVQSAMAKNGGHRLLVLPYIDARAIMNRLDEVCGGFWQSNYDQIEVNKTVAFQCRLSIKINDEWITRSDAAEVSDIESVKGGHSNAMKRAGTQWGIGRYLYDLKPFWVELKQRGEHYVGGNFKVNNQQVYLKGYFDTPSLPDWALPASSNTSQSNLKQKPSVQQQAPQQPRNQKPSTQQPTKQQRTPQEKQQESVNLVSGLLQFLQVPLAYVGPLLTKASGATVPYEQASPEDLGKLYHVLKPVTTYVENCRKFGLDDERLLYYAQIVLKTRLESVHSLLLKMTDATCQKTLAIISEDLKTQKVSNS